MLFSECTIQVIYDPSTGKPIHQVVKLAKDPETGHIVHMITDLPDVADTNSTYQAVTHKDPVTGKVTKDIVQIAIDPESGETIEFPVDVPLGIFNLSFSVTFLSASSSCSRFYIFVFLLFRDLVKNALFYTFSPYFIRFRLILNVFIDFQNS